MSSRFLSSLPWLILLEIFPSIDTRIYNSTAFIQYLFTLHLLFWTIMLLALTFIHLSHHTFAAHLRFPWTTKIRKDGVLLRRLRTGHWPRFAARHTSNECASCSGSVGWFSWSEISCSLEVASYFWTLIDHEAFLNARDNWYPGYNLQDVHYFTAGFLAIPATFLKQKYFHRAILISAAAPHSPTPLIPSYNSFSWSEAAREFSPNQSGDEE